MAAAPTFTLAGIPVRVEPIFFVIVALLGLAYEQPALIASWVAIAFGAILLHELGHAAAFRAFGVQPSIVLTGFGGVTTGRGGLSPGRSLVVSLAGPLSGLVLVGLPALLLARSGTIEPGDGRVVLAQVLWITIGWSLLNLLPILPLDGGAVTASLLDLVRPGRGRRWAAVVSVVVAGAAAVAAAVAGLLFGAVLAGLFVALNVRELGADRRRAVAVDLRTAEQALLAGRADVAEVSVAAVLGARPTPAQAAYARELSGWARLAAGDVAGAAAAVGAVDRSGRPVPAAPAGGGPAGDLVPATGPSPSLRAALALAEGRTGEAQTLASWALVHDPAPLPRALLGLVVARGGLLVPVVDGLVAQGPDGGWPAAARLRDLLASAGDHASVRLIDERLGQAR